jgi:hypothetical protein
VSGTTNSTDTATLGFSEHNGSYPYTVTAPSGYSVTPSTGTVNVSGKSVGVTLSFSKTTPGTNNTPPPTFLGLPGYEGYMVLTVVAAVVVAAVVIALTRRKKAETAPAPSTGYQGYPQQPPYPPGQ